jgi:hypothetical protein
MFLKFQTVEYKFCFKYEVSLRGFEGLRLPEIFLLGFFHYCSFPECRKSFLGLIPERLT